MQRFLRITKALSDETRVRGLLALEDGELCLCQLIDFLELAPSTVSKHMTLLHEAGLVERRKEGRWHFYRLAGPKAPPVVRHAMRLALRNLHEDARIRQDAKQLARVRARSLEEATTCYRS